MLLDQYAAPSQIDLSDFDDIPEDDPLSFATSLPVVPRANSLPTPQPTEPQRTSRAKSEAEIHNGTGLKRTLSRKLPPQLTESLEQLALERHASPPHSPQSVSSRKFSLSRKLPPQLTGSLEVLALQHTPSPHHSPQKTSQALFNLQVDLPTHQEHPDDAAPPVFTIPFETPASTPTSESTPSRRQSKKHYQKRPSVSSSTSTMPSIARRAISTAAIGWPSSPSSKTSTHLMTPSSSIGHIRGSYESHPVSCSSGSASTCGTWSAVDDYDYAPKKREGRKEKKERKKAEKAAFDVDTPPTMRALYEASLMELIDEHGDKVRFGDLVRRGTTIVVFIRHCKWSPYSS